MDSADSDAQFEAAIGRLDDSSALVRSEAVLSLLRSDSPKAIRAMTLAKLPNLALSDVRYERLTGYWAMCRLGRRAFEPATPVSVELVERLLSSWEDDEEASVAVGAIRGLSLLPGWGHLAGETKTAERFETLLNGRRLTVEEEVSAIVLAFHLAKPYSRDEIEALVVTLAERPSTFGLRKLEQVRSHLRPEGVAGGGDFRSPEGETH